MTYQTDPIYQSMTNHFQKGEWEEGLKLLDELIDKFPLEHDLVSMRQMKINGHQTGIVPTGIAVDIPAGYYGQIRDRSGFAVEHTLQVKAGVIDSGYRGEIGVVMANHGPYPREILKDQKIAQLVSLPVPQVEFKKVGKLTKSPRDTDGFGSTDKKEK